MATAAIILETRKTLSDGTHPVKLRLTHNRIRKYYTLKVTDESIGLSADDWKKANSERPRKIHKEIRDTLQTLESDAREILKNMPAFSFEAFEALYFKRDSKVDLFAAMAATAAELNKEGRIKTAGTYDQALKSLKTFARTDKLLFVKVTPDWLRKYEKWMLAKDRSKTTISMYLRAVRAAFNKAGITDAYPFGKGKFEMPTGRNVKKALTIQDVALIYRYDAIEGSTRQKCRDYWVLSYLCNGANIKDLAFLKYKNIDNDSITFVRKKTARKTSRAVVVPLTADIGRLIDRHGQKPATPDAYVLPILRNDMTPKQQQVAIDNTVRLINKQIKVIAENIGIQANVTTYTARHTFATVLKRSGASIEFISESLGHSNLRTTENYLADFEMDQKRKMAEILTNWE